MIKLVKNLCLVSISTVFLLILPNDIHASQYLADQVRVEMSSNYMVKVSRTAANLYSTEGDQSDVVGEVPAGQVYQVLDYNDNRVKIDTGKQQGYLELSDAVTLLETTTQTVDTAAVLRDDVVAYALQFVGKAYRYGGSDPNSGVDCSGFTAYVMRHAANVNLPHSSSGQSRYGTQVTLDRIKPGDLLFYSSGSSINHVAMYIGNGQIVHASTERSGIKVSSWNYRTPVKAMDLLSNK